MFIKSDIRKVSIALEKALGHEVYVRLGREGIIHLARLRAVDALTDTGFAAEEERTRDILAGSGFVLNALQMEVGEAVVSETMRDSGRDAEIVAGAKKTVERLQRLRDSIREKAALVAEQLEYAGALNRMGIDPAAVKKARFVRVVFGAVPDAVCDWPADGPFIVSVADGYVVGAALPQAVTQMLQFLEGCGFVDKTADLGGMSLESLKGREADLMRRLEVLEQYTERFKTAIASTLQPLYRSYKGHEEVLKAMRLSAFSEKAMFITGWMDARDRQRLIAVLREICGERFVVSDERDRDAPVRLMNIRLFKPFELIVRMMGMPANSEIDPTPLAAVTFVIVFGLMFGDLGQGLVLAAAGLVLKSVAGKKGREDIVQAGAVLTACGLSAALCGILYGSVFSSEHLIPALWIRPAENIMGLFSATILLGAVIIAVGLCAGIANALINADYPEALLGKRGVAVLILYSAAVFFSIRYAHHLEAPAPWEIGAFVALPLVLFSLRGVLGPILFRAARPPDLVEYATGTVVEILEIALGLFTNTLSFIRVGAFALSRVGFSIVTFELAGMADPALQSPAAVAIVIAGNIVSIGFEGMICLIQSVRLEYYEFFSKFFRGDGVVFSPFVLHARVSEV
ncbi:MAG: V-type ATP synthase subunit I [Syntrophaceae bacterium]